jgi:hypothetical protein
MPKSNPNFHITMLTHRQLGRTGLGDLSTPSDFDLHSTISSIFGSASWLDFGVPELPLTHFPDPIPSPRPTPSVQTKATEFTAHTNLQEHIPKHDINHMAPDGLQSGIMFSTGDTLQSPDFPTAREAWDVSTKFHDWLLKTCTCHPI